ncbi:MAG: hypothetical protein PVI21_03285 [Candidatus Woesebacteria bacterium]|jgi:hypothetical protein
MVKKQQNESNSTYFLKLVLYVILGSFWLKFQEPLLIGDFLINGFPLGLIIGIFFATHDHFAIDRKIEYAVLVIVTILTFFVPAGIVI